VTPEARRRLGGQLAAIGVVTMAVEAVVLEWQVHGRHVWEVCLSVFLALVWPLALVGAGWLLRRGSGEG
jgi:hypothetical protein